ncbi:hypothetical protein ETAA8_09880 [Anatilimnocola aggregata]|uniref:Uncharacterized protein n=1 Tax=Anatilimnocola aggregata TaxID=2528021 RepID=A0A517Y6S3_9BACT|nr:DUF6807 family protein [Anatilimnocola aggregata]QDU25916.1 hypothetical protein ETAA8_09880 [Anatilimnocola aggregata]
MRSLLSLFLLPVLCTASLAAAETFSPEFEVAAGNVDRTGQPIRVPVVLPAAFKAADATLTINGQKIPAQVTQPSLLSKPAAAPTGGQNAELVFIAPAFKAGDTLKGTATISTATSIEKPVTEWKDTPGEYMDLIMAGKPVLRYMYAKLDETNKDTRSATFKPYHHVFDPEGKRLITKGPGGKFPHHRGLYFGFNRISYGEKQTADTWHCNNGEFQSHEKVLASEAGPVLGRHTVQVDWHGKDGKAFAQETREMTAYNTAGGTLIEFATRLDSLAGPVKLDGDPQHAGFQFRATQEVPDKTAAQTYYLRPDGKGDAGKFRNWPADKAHVDLPWNALSIVLDDQRYTIGMLDRPQNPKEARFSERDYGRFGSYFEYEIDAQKSLELNYRVWVQKGEMTVAEVTRLDDAFVYPAEVKVK